MNKTFLYIFVFLLAISFVFAAGNQDAKPVVTGANSEAGSPQTYPGNQGVSNGSGSEDATGYEHEVAVQTVNQGESSQLKVQTSSEFGSTIKSEEGGAEAKTEMKLSQEADGKTYAELSNGMNSEIKVMPETASQKALDTLGANCEEKGCEIELKEVGKGEETKAAYEVQAKKQVKLLGLIKTQMKVKAQVDAESGEVVKTRNSWWGFLAKKNLEE